MDSQYHMEPPTVSYTSREVYRTYVKRGKQGGSDPSIWDLKLYQDYVKSKYLWFMVIETGNTDLTLTVVVLLLIGLVNDCLSSKEIKLSWNSFLFTDRRNKMQRQCAIL